MKTFFRTRYRELLLLIFIFAVVTRLGNLFAALDYDEIWTMTYFSAKDFKTIFTELSLPNNQPLNSLFVKFALLLELPLWGIRLHSLVAGVLAVMLMVPIGLRLFRSRTAALLSALFLLCSAPAAAYAQLARGYELQLFFLLLYAWGLLYSDLKKYRISALCAIAAGGVCSVLTLSTSVIYLGVITLGFFILRPRFPGKALGALLLAGLIFCALWYGFNFHHFKAGQQWGTAITSHKAFFTFAFKTLDALIPLLWCPFLICGFALLPRRLNLVLTGGIAAVLLTALLTRGGGERVYIPLVIPAALICGAGAALLSSRLKKYAFLPVAAALLCGAGGLYFNAPAWTPPDWYDLYARGKKQPPRTLVIYSGTNGYPVMWNNQPDSLEENTLRLKSEPDRMLCFTSDSSLNGVDERFNESTLSLSSKGLPRDGGFLYALEKISHPRTNDELILISCGTEKVLDSALFEELKKSGSFLRLNIFFEAPPEPGTVAIIRGGIVRDGELFNKIQLPETIKLFRIKTIERNIP